MWNLNNYEPVRSQVLPDGEYYFIIRHAEIKNGKNEQYLDITVQAKGKPGWTPNSLYFGEQPVVGRKKANGDLITDEDVRKWNRKMTTFADAFDFSWDKDINDVSFLVGKKGWCRVEPQFDKNEEDKKSKKYKQIVPFVKVEEPEEQEEAPVQEPNPEEYKPAPESVQPPIEKIDEDIPF